MTALYKKIAKERNRKWLGWKGEVFINEIGKNNTLMGRNDEYKPIVVKEGRLGDIKKVRIIKVETHYLIGQTEN
jgi:tRNA A37 methylthiotransferase MiaB